MSERQVKYSAFTVVLRPCNWHDYRAKIGCRQHRITRIDMHVILLRCDREIVESFGDWAGGWANIDLVRHAVVAGMRNPLPADHKLVLSLCAEGAAHTTVIPRQGDALLNGC